MSLSKIEFVPLVLFYTPLECNNPIIIVNLEDIITVDISFSKERRDLFMFEGLSDILVDKIEGLLNSFLNVLKREIGEAYFRIKVAAKKNPYGLGLYVVLTHKLLKLLGLSDDESYEIGVAVDRELFQKEPLRYLLKALRTAVKEKKNIVFREGEPYIEIPFRHKIVVEDYMRLKCEKTIPTLLKEQAIRASIIHLGGYTALSLARCLLTTNECLDIIHEALHILNSMTFLTYNLYPPLKGAYIEDIPGLITLIDVI